MIKKIVAIIVLIMVASLSVAGCTVGLPDTSSLIPTPMPTPTPIASTETVIGNNTTFSSAAGFSITYPTKLKIDSNNSADTQVRIYVYLATDNTNSTSKQIDGVLAGTEAVGPNATSLEYVTYAVNKISNYSNFKLISNQSTTLGDKPAYTVVWQATVPVQMGRTAATVQNTTLKVMWTCVVNNNTAYTITYKTLPGDYNTYLAQAQQIMNSFELS